MPISPDRPLSLRRNFLWTVSGNLVYGLCQWGVIVVLARLGSKEMVGEFAFGLAITAPVILFTNLQLRAVQATDARGQFDFRDYFGLRLITLASALLAVAVVVVAAGFERRLAWIVVAVACAKCFESLSDLFYGFFQRRERMDRVGLSLALKGLLSLGALTLTVFLTGNLLYGVTAMAASWAALWLAVDAWNCARMSGGLPRPIFRRRVLGSLALLTLPLGFTRLLVSLQTNIPRYFVEHQLGLADLGVFAALSYVVVMGSRVVHALGESASPRLARHLAAGDERAFRSLLLRLTGLALALGAGGIALAGLAGPSLLALLYGPDYAARNDVFVVIMVAAAIGYVNSLMEYVMTAARRLRVQVALLLSAGVTLVVVCALLVPARGLIGAAWSLAAAALVQCVGAAVVIASIRFAPRGTAHG